MSLYSLINKDIKAENENKRVIVSLRVLYIIVFIAFICDVLLAGSGVFKAFAYRIILLSALIIVLFIHTYYSRTKSSLFAFMIYLFGWTLLMIPCFGWSAGMQNYFIIMLMLCFFAMHGKPLYKFIYAGFVLVIRILIILLFSGTKPVVEISSICDKLLQITNISAVFISIIFISYVFSKKENEAENKLMKYNDRLKKEASTDRLTGLNNRRKAEEYLARLKNDDNASSVSVAMGDIDFFKKVNDTYGHDAGDEVLKFVAKTMVDNCRTTAFISRWGGEEFLLIFPDCNGDQAFIVLERLRNLIQKGTIVVGENQIKVTMTFGLSEFNYSKNDEQAIKEADEKLYIGKSNGRNQVVF